MNIDSLPLETFLEILRRTDGPTLGLCRGVCRRWKNIIDNTDVLWYDFCQQDFKQASQLAKRKTGKDLKWYHIYKNLYMWLYIASFERNVREFYKFSLHDQNHALEVDSGILPMRDARGVVFFDLHTHRYIPIVFSESRSVKFANNVSVTVIQVETDLLVQRTVENEDHLTEVEFRAHSFVMHKNNLFFHYYRDVYKCDLTSPDMPAQLIINANCDIKQLRYSNQLIHLFTDCGNIHTVDREGKVMVKPIKCPNEWAKQIKHICAYDDTNFICYSRNLFKIETDHYDHLYLDFPPITCVFFYIDIVLLGTRHGDILVYRLDNQRYKSRPTFETLCKLPDNRYPTQLDVCEKRTGPVIIASTYYELYLLEFFFFPHDYELNREFSEEKLSMCQRIFQIQDRFYEDYESSE